MRVECRTHRPTAKLLAACLVLAALAFTSGIALAAGPPAAASAASSASSPASSASSPKAIKCPADASKELCDGYQTSLCAQDSPADLCQAKIDSSPAWRIWHWFLRDGVPPVLTVLSAGLAYLSASLAFKLKDLAKRLGDPVTPRAAKRTFITRGVNVLIAGDAGRGKTSIVRALSGSYLAAPSRATNARHTYSIVYEVDIEAPIDQKGLNPRLLERVYINDFKGTNIEDGVEVTELNERERLVPSTVLLLVVDLFVTPADALPATGPHPALDAARIKENTDFFNEGVLRILLTRPKKLTQTILFINKVDLWRPLPAKAKAKIEEEYVDLIGRIATMGREKEFIVIVGSAARGDGVVGVNSRDGEAPKTLYEVLKKRMST